MRRRLRAYRRAIIRGAIRGIPVGIYGGWYARKMYRLGVGDGIRHEADLWLEAFDKGLIQLPADVVPLVENPRVARLTSHPRAGKLRFEP